MNFDHETTAEIMRLLLVAGICMGVIIGVALTGLLVTIQR